MSSGGYDLRRPCRARLVEERVRRVCVAGEQQQIRVRIVRVGDVLCRDRVADAVDVQLAARRQWVTRDRMIVRRRGRRWHLGVMTGGCSNQEEQSMFPNVATD